jgi:hypothetical protein
MVDEPVLRHFDEYGVSIKAMGGLSRDRSILGMRCVELTPSPFMFRRDILAAPFLCG